MNNIYRDIALELARKAHEGQVDKAGESYLQHPIAVAAMVDGDIAKSVALLHDTIEDSDMTINDLKENGFPNEIVDAIVAITKIKGENYESYLTRVANNPIATQVKFADLTHNSSISRFEQPTDEDIQRCEKYKMRIEQLKSLTISQKRGKSLSI